MEELKANKCECKECHCDEECNCSNQKEINHEEKKDKKKMKKNDIVKNLEIKIKELEEKNLKEKAELINYRKRKDEEIHRMLKYSNEDLVKELLTIVDNFERAIKLDDEDLTDELSKFLSGFKMIYAHMQNLLEKFDVKAIDGFNKPFDPVYHEAMLTAKVDNVAAGTVVEVLQKGYLLKDRVIRPAMVKVSE